MVKDTYLKTAVGTIMIVCLCFSSALAYSGGSGEANDPYQIATVADWNDLMNTPADWNQCFLLTADVNLRGVDATPIGNEVNQFTGFFNGNNHIIKNICIGVFGYINGVVCNLGALEVNIIGSGDVGGLAACNGGSISNCYSTGAVSGRLGVGGLCGVNYGDITNCYSSGTVINSYASQFSESGGLVGFNCIGEINNCSSDAIVSGVIIVGGLAGINYNGVITNSYATGHVTGGNGIGGLVGDNSGSISNCYSTGAINGNENYIGGLTGLNNGNITACYTTGAVNGSGNYIGGLAGENEGFILDCYSTDTINGNSQIGGLTGYNANIVKNCYSTGAVSGNSYTGGLAGQNDGYVIFSFWDINTSGQTTSAGGEGKTTTQMQDIDTFLNAGWDFSYQDGSDAIWFMPVDDYPILTWQISPADIYTDGKNNFMDFATFAQYWMRKDCRIYNDYCDFADLNFDGKVDYEDLLELMSYWLEEGIYN